MRSERFVSGVVQSRAFGGVKIQLEKIRKSETLAGKFFGDVGEISVRQWRGKIYNDKVFRGIEDITGVSGAGPMRSGTKGISQKVGGKLAW